MAHALNHERIEKMISVAEKQGVIFSSWFYHEKKLAESISKRDHNNLKGNIITSARFKNNNTWQRHLIYETVCV